MAKLSIMSWKWEVFYTISPVLDPNITYTVEYHQYGILKSKHTMVCKFCGLEPTILAGTNHPISFGGNQPPPVLVKPTTQPQTESMHWSPWATYVLIIVIFHFHLGLCVAFALLAFTGAWATCRAVGGQRVNKVISLEGTARMVRL